MREQPTTAELVEIVTEFLRTEMAGEASGQASGRTAYHLRVAINVLAIVQRELTSGPGALAREQARLAALLGRAGEGEELNAELCRRIGHGEIAFDDPALIEHLWATTLDTVAIDQPNYATFRRHTGAHA